MALSPEMVTAITSGTLYPVTLLKILATNGTDVIRVALHTRDYVFLSETYTAFPFEMSKFQLNSGGEPDNATVKHMLEGAFTRLNLIGGKWAGATVTAYVCDFLHPEWGYARKHVGRIGEVVTGGYLAETEFRGLMQLLTQTVGWRVGRLCRYQTGDSFCGINLASYTISRTISGVTNNQKFSVNGATLTTNDYAKGRIIFTSGTNNGLKMEIANNTNNLITLLLPMPNTVSAGDGVNLILGDDKTLVTCAKRFNNAINFGGEDGAPTKEQVFKIPD